MAQAQVNGRRIDLVPLATLSVLLVVLLWAYWNSLLTAARYWDNPKYSHGYMVPLFTLVLLWLRRDIGGADRPASWPMSAADYWPLAAGLLAAATYLDIPVAANVGDGIARNSGGRGRCAAGDPAAVARKGGAVGSRGRHWACCLWVWARGCWRLIFPT